MEKNKEIEILLVGDSTWPMYVNAFYATAKTIVKANLFDFGILNAYRIENSFILKAENKLSFGLSVLKKNIDLLKLVKEKKFEYIFFYSARIISWRTIRRLRRMGITIGIYCNDNPFSNYYPKYFWRNIRKSVKYCDITYSYRKSDMIQYTKSGASNVRLLRSYYNENRSYMIENITDSTLYVPKIIFLGHMENDERTEYLDSLVNRGIEIGIRKTDEWQRYAKNRDNIVIFEETVEHYNEIINKAEIALVFLSKINQDTYTRRCFEITATGTMMLAPYNDDLASLFKENEEVVFYRNKQDFIEKVEYYLDHLDEARKIGLKGRKRVLRDGHGAMDRMRQVISEMTACREEVGKKKDVKTSY